MNVLDSPVEALAFNYLSFGSLTLLNNVWTWLALLTAALSFWTIRSATYPKPKPDYPTPTRTEPATEVLLPDAVTQSPPPPVVVEEIDGVRKGKFTVYYEEEVQCEREGLLTMTVMEDWKEREGCEEESEWWERWETLLRLRNGENEKGWYTCQDLTELNGNVVRLWDGELRFRSNYGTLTKESDTTPPAIFMSGNNNDIMIACLSFILD